MRVFSRDSTGILYQGDCLEVMRWLPSDSVDTLITDPPYGLSFMGKKWDYQVPGIKIWKECLRILKPGATALIFAGTRTQHRMAVNVEDAGFILKDTIMWIYGSGFPKSTDISKQIDKIAGAKREVIGKYTVPIDSDAGNAGKVIRSVIQEGGCFGSTAGKTGTLITAPATSEAKLWNGWGTALKPAYEPILVAMKPNDGTYAQNALRHGVAGLNIDGGRIETDEIKMKDKENESEAFYGRYKGKYQRHSGNGTSHTKGRFPANIILDPEAGRLLDVQSGILKCQGNKLGKNIQGRKSGMFNTAGIVNDGNNYKDKGGASRFFYCAKASKSERGDNSHPTVKPLALMEYLCRLTATPTGGTVLDPFAGSATTGLACINTNREFILIERKADYCEIATERIRNAHLQKTIRYFKYP